MDERKSELISFRISKSLLDSIDIYAKKHKWTKSFAVCEILKEKISEISEDR